MADFSLTDTGDLAPAAAPKAPAASPASIVRSPEIPHSMPGGLQPNPDAPPAPIMPLSPAAAHLQDVGLFGGLGGNRALAGFAEQQFAKDPSVINRGEVAKDAAKQASDYAAKQSSGTQLISGIRALIDRTHSMPEETWARSFGPENSTVVPVKTVVGYYHPTAWSMPDMEQVKARALYYPTPENKAAFKNWNEMHHLYEAATEGLLGTANKAAAGSDARMEVFKDMIQRAGQSPDRAGAIRIAHDAEDRIRKNSFMGPRPGSAEAPLPVKTKADFANVGIGEYAQLPGGQIVQKPYIMPDTPVPNTGQIRALHTVYADPAKREQFKKAHGGMSPEDVFMKKFGLAPETLRDRYLPNYQQEAPNLPQ